LLLIFLGASMLLGMKKYYAVQFLDI
jgi:hypothetical protein